MIIVKLSGGLGNQMFQYACGRALARKFSVPLKLDHSFLEDKSKTGITLRDYELYAFGIDKKINKAELSALGLDSATTSPYKTLFSVKRLLSGYKFYIEKGLAFNDELFKQGPKGYILGYFQNEKYFRDIQENIRKDFTFISSASEKNIQLANRIKNAENAVSVHGRRGDFLSFGNDKIHSTCEPSYYMNAIAMIKNKISNPVFFIFATDDPQWAEDNIKIDGPFELIGKQNAAAGYEDMRLMSMCKHHIIANSSFSWWAAWLNPNPDKIVVAPKKWFNDSKMDTKNRLPQ